MNTRIIFYSLLILFTGSLTGCSEYSNRKPVDYVNPYMGNISHLLVPTYPAIHLPNSMLRVIPARKDFTGDKLNGLPVILTSHRGSSAFNISPYQGKENNIKPVIQYSYDQEKLTPYSYSVYLDEQHITVNFGLSRQSAMYAFEFEKEDDAYIIVNSKTGKLGWDGTAIYGYQLIENETYVYLYMVPDEKPEKILVLTEGNLVENADAQGRDACLVLRYGKEKMKLSVRYGISFISEDQAKVNMEREVVTKSIESLHSEGREIWNKALGKIKVKGGSYNTRVVFYTSLYRCYERPVCISEGGRYYSPFDRKIHNDDNRSFFIDDWIWDTYRALHPLYILINRETEEDILNSYVLMAEQMENLWMPTFPEITGDGRKMNSNHGVATVIDAYRKGLKGFDLEKAYQACKGAITEKTLAPWSGKPAGELDKFYKEHGYIPAIREGEPETIPEVHSFEKRQPVAVTLGTAYDEWCLAQIAQELDKQDDYEYFSKRAFNYRNLFNPETQFFHPKDMNGEFIQPFDYVFSGGQGARYYYSENNAWIYRWDVPHNIPDLIELMGGKEQFVLNLDQMYSTPLGKSKFQFYAQLPDHTGNVGQFSMANEPSLHIPYLYNYAGQAWKTQKRVRTLLNQWFRNDLMGVPGDEDGGGMSAFVVFSSLGFYPVTPGLPSYTIGSPLFDFAEIKLSEGKKLTIKVQNNSEENKYIQSVRLNGEPLDIPFFLHQDIKEGGKMIITMGDKPNFNWGADYDMNK